MLFAFNSLEPYRITSKPFLPIIVGLQEWRVQRDNIKDKLRKRIGVLLVDKELERMEVKKLIFIFWK